MNICKQNTVQATNTSYSEVAEELISVTKIALYTKNQLNLEKMNYIILNKFFKPLCLDIARIHIQLREEVTRSALLKALDKNDSDQIYDESILGVQKPNELVHIKCNIKTPRVNPKWQQICQKKVQGQQFRNFVCQADLQQLKNISINIKYMQDICHSQDGYQDIQNLLLLRIQQHQKILIKQF
ncbi:unnamed protein product (macronuclear) [Paramecium tetraurelia]|uniref:Uncharacterized protein n=1 Tax=Paramecium tetraurelia TaxID=5888 RepID=A0BEB9_PARTE|nr:uncharacterized protein GSPATT00027919001 [Paramecium tetraurelia]CAK56886.1 unnamed protein product [Paramecium tetraurelia]|eukprot:XP_001424284.1 hypothetical protein (macronuclear) [Paramecium tetraurelia strain d4-2]